MFGALFCFIACQNMVQTRRALRSADLYHQAQTSQQQEQLHKEGLRESRLQSSAAAAAAVLVEQKDIGYYRSVQEFEGRRSRFPSVEDRLKVYMSTWYVPPCPDDPNGLVRYTYVHKEEQVNSQEAAMSTSLLIQLATPMDNNKKQENEDPPLLTLALNSTIHRSRYLFYLDRKKVKACQNKYCIDTMDYVFPALDRIANTSNKDDDIPIIMQFGDAEEFKTYKADGSGEKVNYPMVPVVKKFRNSMTAQERERVTTHPLCDSNSGPSASPLRVASTVRIPNEPPHNQAIITVLKYDRHFGPLKEVPGMDTPWEKKLPTAIWRGALTGKNRIQVKTNSLDEQEWCHRIPRCHLVLKHGNSTRVDAKLQSLDKEKYPISPSIANVSMYGKSLTMAKMLQYKAIIMLEGNDVSSGLKWALFSDSVVLMTKPTCTSWAMEELLEPWVHYIPLADDFADVEDKVQWIEEHDAEAREIARRGRLWMTDLVFHPDAASDNQQVLDETFRRYQAHFVRDDNLKHSIPISAQDKEEKEAPVSQTTTVDDVPQRDFQKPKKQETDAVSSLVEEPSTTTNRKSSTTVGNVPHARDSEPRTNQETDASMTHHSSSLLIERDEHEHQHVITQLGRTAHQDDPAVL